MQWDHEAAAAKGNTTWAPGGAEVAVFGSSLREARYRKPFLPPRFPPRYAECDLTANKVLLILRGLSGAFCAPGWGTAKAVG